MRWIAAVVLIGLVFCGTARAASLEKLALLRADRHPLTVDRALRVADQLYDGWEGWRRGSGRVVHVRVVSFGTTEHEDGTFSDATLHTGLTVKLRRDGTIAAYDSLFGPLSLRHH